MSGRAARTAEVVRLASRVGAAEAAYRARRAFASAGRRRGLAAEIQLRRAEEVAEVLGNMKGALMKVGQLASFVDDSMPEPVRQALCQLQQDAPPMSPELAAQVVEEELGAPPDRVFAKWDPVPIAAASIGQVHRAMTHDGIAVAVKVQYPGVEEAIRADLDNLDLTALVVPFLWGSIDARGMAEEVRTRLAEELDYVREAANQRAFARWYRDHPFIRVPDVLEGLSRRRVLTAELGEGARFNEMEGWPQPERDLAAEAIFRFVFHSLYQLHAFNGDPHPGNYLFQPGGRVTFLDFGLVKYFTDEDIAQLAAMVRYAVLEPDAAALRSAAEDAGYFVRGAPLSDARVAEYCTSFYQPVLRDEVTTITAEFASDLARHLMLAHQTFPEVMKWGNIEPRFLVLQRINVGLTAILGRLEATANWRRIAEEIWPMTNGPASTELGREHARWWAASGSALTAVPALTVPPARRDTRRGSRRLARARPR